MSIFGSIVSKIFGHANAAPAPSAPASSQPSSPPVSPTVSAPGASFNNPTAQTASPGHTTAGTPAAAGTSAAPTASPSTSQPPVDVAAILNDMANKNAQKLDWHHSIVDLMKLLDLDSSLPARQELAQELHYSGSTTDSAAMNVWLHKQVMQKLAENGGKVPEELRT